MYSNSLEDPIRSVLQKIVDITFSLVSTLRKEGKIEEANQLILWVSECLHCILVRKLKFYQTRPFTPMFVRQRYAALKARASVKVARKRGYTSD